MTAHGTSFTQRTTVVFSTVLAFGGSFTVKLGRKRVTIGFDTQSKTQAELKESAGERDGEVIGLYDAKAKTIYIASDVVSDPNEPE